VTCTKEAMHAQHTFLAFLTALSALAFLSSSCLTASRGPSSCFFISSLQNSYMSSTIGNATCITSPSISNTCSCYLFHNMQTDNNKKQLSTATAVRFCFLLLSVELMSQGQLLLVYNRAFQNNTSKYLPQDLCFLSSLDLVEEADHLHCHVG